MIGRSSFALGALRRGASLNVTRGMCANVPSNSDSKSALNSSSSSEMFRRKRIVKDNRDIIQKWRKINADHESKAKEMGLNFRVLSSTVLHRYPEITDLAEDWEVDMMVVQEKMEQKQRESLMGEIGGTEAMFMEEQNPTYEEILESLPFEPASRETQADIDNDRRSMNRKLNDSCFLIVKRNRGDELHPWQFPQGKIVPDKDQGVNARNAAERVIDRAVGKTKRWFVSNAPIGYISYAYPAAVQDARKEYGAKVYFYRAQFCAGSVKLETRLYTDYAWVGRDEVGEYFDEDTAEYLQSLLPN